MFTCIFGYGPGSRTLELRIWFRQKFQILADLVLYSDPVLDTDPDPQGSGTFAGSGTGSISLRIRIRLRINNTDYQYKTMNATKLPFNTLVLVPGLQAVVAFSTRPGRELFTILILAH
jgi:hypothetical protein